VTPWTSHTLAAAATATHTRSHTLERYSFEPRCASCLSGPTILSSVQRARARATGLCAAAAAAAAALCGERACFVKKRREESEFNSRHLHFARRIVEREERERERTLRYCKEKLEHAVLCL
jgi:hypothetical protein